jgi:hypothetical protein
VETSLHKGLWEKLSYKRPVWDKKICGETSTCLAKDSTIFVSISVQQYKFNTLGGIVHRLLVREEYIIGIQFVLYQERLATPQLR